MCRFNCASTITISILTLAVTAAVQAGDKQVTLHWPSHRYSYERPTTRPASYVKAAAMVSPRRSTGSQFDFIYSRTGREFQNAIFYKPSDQTAEPERHLAPLIVQEIDDPNAASNLRIGAVDVDAAGQPTVDIQRPVVYSAQGYVRLGTTYCEQWTHIWATPGENGRGVEWHGVRTTYGPSRWPLVWEALNTKDEPIVLFVSKSFEEAAQKQFGRPPAGRRQAAERSLDQQPNVVVARQLPDGKEPMGPVVYEDAASRSITTLLCRCMKSQVNNFVENPYYQLLPIDILTDVHVAADGPFRLEKGPATGKPHSDRSWLEQALRVPKRLD